MSLLTHLVIYMRLNNELSEAQHHFQNLQLLEPLQIVAKYILEMEYLVVGDIIPSISFKHGFSIPI